MRKIWTWVACCVAVIAVAFGPEAQARPDYLNKGFTPTYPALKAEVETAKCGVCHFGDKKTNRNDYGKAVGEALGEKNVKDEAKIKEALTKAEKGKSSTEGKTFGDLIKGGKLPGKNP